MSTLGILLTLAAAGLAATVVWLLMKNASLAARLAEAGGRRSELEAIEADLRERVDALGRESSSLRARSAELEREHAEKGRAFQEFVAKRDAEIGQRFQALAADCLKGANTALLQLAQERFQAQQQLGQAEHEKRQQAVSSLVQPIAETLKKTDEKLGHLQKEWTQDRSTLQEQIRALGSAGESLRIETSKLARALGKPEVRGRYGEIQLKRVAELAGMVAYCDFAEQASQRDDEGQLLRPDMLVRMPDERMIAVDAKCNILAYLEAVEAESPELREDCLQRFADHIVSQVSALGRKRYWSAYEGSPDFVVMFVPGDQFLDAALSRRAELLERAAEQNVILATPSSLIGLLRVVAVGWREKSVADRAQELIALGKELHERSAVAMSYVAKLGEALDMARKRYNDFVGSYESRLAPTLRKFKEVGAGGGKEEPELASIEGPLRSLLADVLPVLPSGEPSDVEP